MEQPKKQAYTCRIFTVWEEEISLPHGRTFKQSWVDHKPTVAVVAVNDKKEMILIRQFRNPAKQILWEIPAGTMDNGPESPMDCARRELAEETGFRAEKLIEPFSGFLLPGYCNEHMYFFLAEGLVFDPLKPDDDEFIEVFPTSFARAFELLENREIIDAKTALGMMLADNYLNNKKAFSTFRTKR